MYALRIDKIILIQNRKEGIILRHLMKIDSKIEIEISYFVT